MFTLRLFGGSVVTSLPCSQTVPDVGSSKPAIIRMVVVLPQPDGPSIEKNSPSLICRSIVRTAEITSPPEWKSFVTPESSMAGRPPAVASAVAAEAGAEAGAWPLPAVAGACILVMSATPRAVTSAEHPVTTT